jgi:DNA-binding transcriptional MerR regulator
MNNVKNMFRIKDLENISGIKAHTIRIWEKRYNVLQPIRTHTNIRLYSLSNLQKLLNITMLHGYGYKISKIATLPADKIPEMVLGIISNTNVKNHSISAFKMAMMNFDQELFSNTYNRLQEEKSFNEIFHQVFVPLMEEFGLLWHTDTISTTHKHFISCLIIKKILINIEKVENNKPIHTDRVFVLSLPIQEIHELGLLFLHYEIVSKGYKVIYLGQNLPIENLKDLKKYFDSIVFLSYFTIQPERNTVDEYIKEMSDQLLGEGSEIWLIDRITKHIDLNEITTDIKVFNSISALIKNV